MIRQGVPSIGLVHEPFEKLARMQARQLGMPDAPLLIYSQDLPSADPPELVQKKAQEVAARLADMVASQRKREGGAS
jgi:hypothetical protein